MVAAARLAREPRAEVTLIDARAAGLGGPRHGRNGGPGLVNLVGGRSTASSRSTWRTTGSAPSTRSSIPTSSSGSRPEPSAYSQSGRGQTESGPGQQSTQKLGSSGHGQNLKHPDCGVAESWAPCSSRFYEAKYADLQEFLDDLRLLIHDNRFDTVQGFAVENPAGGWLYSLEATKSFAPGQEPDDAVLLAGLRFLPDTLTVRDMPYFDYLNRLAPLVAFLQEIGVWFFPHPWLDLMLPDDRRGRWEAPGIPWGRCPRRRRTGSCTTAPAGPRSTPPSGRTIRTPCWHRGRGSSTRLEVG